MATDKANTSSCELCTAPALEVSEDEQRHMATAEQYNMRYGFDFYAPLHDPNALGRALGAGCSVSADNCADGAAVHPKVPNRLAVSENMADVPQYMARTDGQPGVQATNYSPFSRPSYKVMEEKFDEKPFRD